MNRRGLVVLCALLAGGHAQAKGEPPVLVLLGSAAASGGDLEAAAAGARVALSSAPGPAGRAVVLDDGGTEAGLAEAWKKARELEPSAVLALPSGDLEAKYLETTRSGKAPWLFLPSVAPNPVTADESVVYLGPTHAAQAIVAADALVAPIGARRVAVVFEATERGRELFGGFARNRSSRVALAGSKEWPLAGGREAFDALRAMEADWIYAAVTGAYARSFVEAMRDATWPTPKVLFADGNRSERLLTLAPKALAESLWLDGPDPELAGREGQRLADGLVKDGVPIDSPAARGFEAARLVLAAIAKAETSRGPKVAKALAGELTSPGVLGAVAFEPWGGIRFFPFTLWTAKGTRNDLWPRGWLPAPGCGPPLGFGLAPPGEVGKRGKIGFLTYTEGEKRTIEEDLLKIGLSTNRADEDMDRFCRDEILARAIRIAHRLFRREADGTPIPGWSWGMTFTVTKPSDDLPHSKVWLGLVGGDHPAAGGQVIGSGIAAIYSTFIRRTMYDDRKLDPPLSLADKPLLDGTWRWGKDMPTNLRADQIRCLLDGFASAVGLTLAHEFGHCSGCGHDTEAPTSIMNVVAGAGASWEEAVWIPLHQRSLDTILGVEGVR